MTFSIALDGPSGAGKSTLAKAVAKQLGIVYVDTGAMYRTIAFFMLSNDIDLHNQQLVCQSLNKIDIKLAYINGEQRIFLNGNDVSDDIRQNNVSMAASVVSAYKEVRSFLMDTQRNVAKQNSVIMDGRDIGTVVLPKAEVKVFLIAQAEVRAKRRFKELEQKGSDISYQQVLEDIIQRDLTDTTRKEAPLKQAEDAVVLDTTNLTLEQAVESLVKIVKDTIKEI